LFLHAALITLEQSEEIERIVQEQVDAFNNRDIDRFLSYYLQGVEILDGEGKLMMAGHEGMRQLYGKLFEQSPTLHAVIQNRIIVNQYVVDEELVSGVNLQGFPSELHAAVIYRIADGKIVRVQQLF
jgi:hypothetical protein